MYTDLTKLVTGRNELVSRVETLESYHNICTGSIPSNATLCNGDDSWLSSATTRTAVDSCTDSRKCEYKCDSWASKNGNSCIYQCNSGNFPITRVISGMNGLPVVVAQLCPWDNSWLSSATTKTLVKNCTNSKKCEYICKSWFYNRWSFCSKCPDGFNETNLHWKFACCPDDYRDPTWSQCLTMSV